MDYGSIDESNLAEASADSDRLKGLTIINSGKAMPTSQEIVGALRSSTDINYIDRITVDATSRLKELNAFTEFQAVTSLALESNKLCDLSPILEMKSLTSIELPKSPKLDLSPLIKSAIVELGMVSPTSAQIEVAKRMQSLRVIGVQGVELESITWEGFYGVSGIKIVKGKGELLRLGNFPRLEFLEVAYCPQLKVVELPEKIRSFTVEACRKLQASRIIGGGGLVELVLQNVGTIDSWAFLGERKALRELEVAATKVEKIVSGDLEELKLRRVFVAGLPNTHEEIRLLSKIGGGLRFSDGVVVYENGKEEQYW